MTIGRWMVALLMLLGATEARAQDAGIVITRADTRSWSVAPVEHFRSFPGTSGAPRGRPRPDPP